MSYPIYHKEQNIGFRLILLRWIGFDALFQILRYLNFIVRNGNALNFFEIKKNLY